MTSAAADVISVPSVIIAVFKMWDITVWKSAWMTSAQASDDVGSTIWTDVIHADFQTVISRRLQNINTYLSCTAERMLRTIIMQNSRLIQACFPIKIDEVWIDRFCVRCGWWRRLQPTSSVSPVWLLQFSKCDFALLSNPAYVTRWLNWNNTSYICVINFLDKSSWCILNISLISWVKSRKHTCDNTMEIIHAIRTLRIVCGFRDMGDGVIWYSIKINLCLLSENQLLLR